MTNILNFDIKPAGPISGRFLLLNIQTFTEATIFVRRLPYGRNDNKSDLTTLFTDNCGTCSTKHALLKKLAEENSIDNLKLMTGIFRMHSDNTPKVSTTLKKYKLNYIPEAHCYLKYKNLIIDCTTETSKSEDFENELIEEIEIQADQIADVKITYHKQYLSHWLEKQKIVHLTLIDIWKIREQCISDLSTKRTHQSE